MTFLDNKFGFNGELDYAFLMNEKNKVYLVNKEFGKIDFENIRINSVGMYFAEFREPELRLSIEGSQLVGNGCDRNMIGLDKEQIYSWLRGQDIEINDIDGDNLINVKDGSYVLLFNLDDKKDLKEFLGCGKFKGGKVMNFVPKERRIKAS